MEICGDKSVKCIYSGIKNSFISNHSKSVWYATSILLPKAEVKAIDFSDCRSNLTINIVRGAKKMRNEWLTMPTLTTENLFFWFQAFTKITLCCWDSWSWRTWLKPRKLERKYFKIRSWEIYRFLWNMSRYVILSIGSDLELVTVFLRKIQTLKISWKTWCMVFAHLHLLPYPNLSRFQTAKMSKNF